MGNCCFLIDFEREWCLCMDGDQPVMSGMLSCKKRLVDVEVNTLTFDFDGCGKSEGNFLRMAAWLNYWSS